MADNFTLNATALFKQPVRYNYTETEWIIHQSTHAVISLLTTFSVFTNLIVIYVMLNKKFGKRTAIQYLYANISLSDELFILACFIEVSFYGGASSCTFHCRRFLGLTIMISGFVSAYTMALIAFKRFYGMAYPFKEVTQNRKKLPFFAAIAVIWTFSISATVYVLDFVKITERHETLLLEQCVLISYSFVAFRDNPYYPLVGMIIIPLLLGLCFSLSTIAILYRRKLIGDHVDIVQLIRDKKRKLRATCMILLVIVSFTVCWLPITVLCLVYCNNYADMELCDYNYNLYAVFTTLLMLSFFANPMIYWYMCPHFRRGIKHILSKLRIMKRREDSTASSSSDRSGQTVQ